MTTRAAAVVSGAVTVSGPEEVWRPGSPSMNRAMQDLMDLPPLQDASQPVVFGINGLRGAGKTAAMTLMTGVYRMMCDQAGHGRIFSNYINRWAHYYDPDMMEFAVQGYLPDGTPVEDGLLLLDEMQQGADRRRWMSKVNFTFTNDFIVQIRKRQLNLVWSTQMAHNIEVRLLEQSNLFIWVDRTPGSNIYNFSIYDYNGNYTLPRKYKLPFNGFDATWRWRWEGVPDVYKAYRHEQQVASYYTLDYDQRQVARDQESRHLHESISNLTYPQATLVVETAPLGDPGSVPQIGEAFLDATMRLGYQENGDGFMRMLKSHGLKINHGTIVRG